MAEGGISVAIVGATGLTGSAILSRLFSTPAVVPVHAIARRTLPATMLSSKLQSHIETNTASWASSLAALQPKPAAFISALGTTRAAAGGVENQRKIDYDLNLELAKKAKETGIETYVLISSAGTSASSNMAYSRMKGELEDEVKKIGFHHTVILRPGLLLGARTETRTAEAILQGVAKGLASLSSKLSGFWAQDVDTIARAAVNAMQECVDGKREQGIWVVEQAEILKLGANA
jgi:uncharacterized protein YbjT (DUF2867 family)